MVSVCRAVQAGDFGRARAEWAEIYPLMDAIMSAPFIPAVKAALRARPGRAVGECRPPILGLDADTEAAIVSLATALPQPLAHS